MDRQQVAGSSYQMRNFYHQLGDGFFSALDVMNYIQHHQIATWAKPGNAVLDVCCGRGLMLPLLRYLSPKIGSYTGLDLSPTNPVFLSQRVTDRARSAQPFDPLTYYPFPVDLVTGNAAELDTLLTGRLFDLLIYTSSIEHMHPDAGARSLVACRKVAKPRAILYLTCPNTPEDQDGYDTQYRAHVYEWKRSELLYHLAASGWEVITEYGLLLSMTDLTAQCARIGLSAVLDRLKQVIPNEWLIPVLSPLFPTVAKEIAIIARAR